MAAVLLILFLYPTVVLGMFTKIDGKYSWWDIGVPAYSKLVKFRANTDTSQVFRLPEKSIEFLDKINPDGLEDRNSIVFLPHLAGLYKVFDLKPTASNQLPVTWYDITSANKNANFYKSVVSNFPERLVLWDNALYTISGHRDLLGVKNKLMVHEIFLRTLACMAHQGLVQPTYVDYGNVTGAIDINNILSELKQVVEGTDSTETLINFTSAINNNRHILEGSSIVVFDRSVTYRISQPSYAGIQM